MTLTSSERRNRGHGPLSAACATLTNLRDWADENSDGWAYWPKPAGAAKSLMHLIEGDCTWGAYKHQQQNVTADDVKRAYRTIKGFLTRQGVDYRQIIVEV